MQWFMGFLGNLRRLLFDFSQGQEEGRRLQRMLRVALAETETEQEFHALLHHILQEDDPLKAATRWAFFMLRLSEYARGGDHGWRIRAERLLADIPRLYGIEGGEH